MYKKILFPGSFDPFTIGHYRLIERALWVFDEVIIAIGNNTNKKTMFTLVDRLNDINNIYKNNLKVSVKPYDTLTMDFCQKTGIGLILRGIRNIKDFEYEKNIADINRKLSDIETIFIVSEPEYAHISSSLVRELIIYNKDISNLIPKV